MEQPTAPRVQTVVRVLPETKQRFVSEKRLTVSITKLVEHAAAEEEAATLDRLKPEHRPRYLADDLTYEQAFGRRPGKRQRDPGLPHVAISLTLTIEARQQLRRFGNFYDRPLGDVLDILSRRLGPGPKPAPEAEPEPQQQPSEAGEQA
jgi:hypothetical protein